MTVRETASYLKVVPKTVNRLISRRELPAVKVGRVWRIRRALLEDWLDSRGERGRASRGELGIASEIKEKILSESKEKILRLVLYGSRARGDARPDSDFDLLVVEKDPVSKRDEAERLRLVVGGLGVPVDVRVMGETEFEETKGVIGGIAYPASREGVILYETA